MNPPLASSAEAKTLTGCESGGVAWWVILSRATTYFQHRVILSEPKRVEGPLAKVTAFEGSFASCLVSG